MVAATVKKLVHSGLAAVDFAMRSFCQRTTVLLLACSIILTGCIPAVRTPLIESAADPTYQFERAQTIGFIPIYWHSVYRRDNPIQLLNEFQQRDLFGTTFRSDAKATPINWLPADSTGLTELQEKAFYGSFADDLAELGYRVTYIPLDRPSFRGSPIVASLRNRQFDPRSIDEGSLNVTDTESVYSTYRDSTGAHLRPPVDPSLDPISRQLRDSLVIMLQTDSTADRAFAMLDSIRELERTPERLVKTRGYREFFVPLRPDQFEADSIHVRFRGETFPDLIMQAYFWQQTGTLDIPFDGNEPSSLDAIRRHQEESRRTAMGVWVDVWAGPPYYRQAVWSGAIFAGSRRPDLPHRADELISLLMRQFAADRSR